jgi:competence protein ComEA
MKMWKSIGLALAALLPLAVFAGPVNINTADAATLARELKGVGLARAQAIVEHRQKNGPFRSADDLTQVKGIGARVVDDNRANIRVDKADKSSVAAVVDSKAAQDKAPNEKAKPRPRDKATGPAKDD